MNKSETLQLIKGALTNLWERDSRLILRKVKEEVINHRIARYLEDKLNGLDENDLEVDLEYNSDGEGKKKIRIKNRFRNIRPDVILHQREINTNNYLAIEIKINTTSSYDRAKLIGLMQPPYNYKYGAAISCLPNNNYFQIILFYCYSSYIWEQTYYFQKTI